MLMNGKSCLIPLMIKPNEETSKKITAPPRQQAVCDLDVRSLPVARGPYQTFPPFPRRSALNYHANSIQIVNTSSL